MANPPTSVFLARVANRLVSYSESEDSDFVRRLRSEAARARTLLANMSANQHTYQLVETDELAMDGRHAYLLRSRVGMGGIGSKLWLTRQQADDLSRQLDAPVDYIND